MTLAQFATIVTSETLSWATCCSSAHWSLSSEVIKLRNLLPHWTAAGLAGGRARAMAPVQSHLASCHQHGNISRPGSSKVLKYGTPPFPWRSDSGPREAVIGGQAEKLCRRCAAGKSCQDRHLTGPSLRRCISAPALCDEYLSSCVAVWVRTWRGSAGSDASTDVTAGGDDDHSGLWAISQTGMHLRPLDRKWN